MLFRTAMAVAEEQPATVTVCQLKTDPAAYNHKLVEVTGFVSRAFEDFTVFDSDLSIMARRVA